MSRDESCDWYHGKLSRIDAENILLEGETDSLHNFCLQTLTEIFFATPQSLK